jgi:hypothetical protein
VSYCLVLFDFVLVTALDMCSGWACNFAHT